MKTTTVQQNTQGVFVDYKKRQQIAPLTSIRAIAIMWVVVYHYHFFMPPIENWHAQQLIRYAFIFLDLFFVLSGFILSYVYYDSFSTKEQLRQNTKKFHLYRLSRIYPLHIIVLFTMLVLQVLGFIPYFPDGVTTIDMLPTNEGDTMSNFLKQLFIVHGFGFGNPINWNYASWSVSTEWLFYIFFPVLAFFIHKLRSNMTCVCLILVLCALLYWHVHDRQLDWHLGVSLYCWVADIPRAMLGCLIGMVLSILYINRFLEKLPWDAILCAVMVIWITLVYFNAPEGAFFIFIPIIILSLCYLKTFLLRALSWKLLVIMGESSYSIFLWHIPLIFFLTTATYELGILEVGTPLPWFMMIPIIVLLVALSILSNERIEKPFRKLMKKYVS